MSDTTENTAIDPPEDSSSGRVGLSSDALLVLRNAAHKKAKQADAEAWKIDDQWREANDREFREKNPELAAEADAINELRTEWVKRKSALEESPIKMPRYFLD